MKLAAIFKRIALPLTVVAAAGCAAAPVKPAAQQPGAQVQTDARAEAGGQSQATAPLNVEAEKKALLEQFNAALAQAKDKGASPTDGAQAELLGVVQAGDLVRVDYTATLEDGSLVRTTLPEVSASNQKRVAWYQEPSAYAAEEILAGKESELFGLGEAVVGMKEGEKKHLVLAPGKAFPLPNPADIVKYPRVRSLPRSIRMPAEEYAKRFSGFPALGKEVELVPYFKAKVAEVSERDVRLEFLAKDGEQFPEGFGSVAVAVLGDKITLTLSLKVGASFPAGERTGLVTAVDEGNFTVDFNHPLAGKPVSLDLEVVSLTKGDGFKKVSLPWLEQHDQGVAAAGKQGKPAVMVLYAEWCQWCKKLFAETLEDPRIKAQKESFVWVKVNSNQQAQYQTKYGQNGFPMIVLLHPDGSVARKIEGFRSGAALSGDLREFLAGERGASL